MVISAKLNIKFEGKCSEVYKLFKSDEADEESVRNVNPRSELYLAGVTQEHTQKLMTRSPICSSELSQLISR